MAAPGAGCAHFESTCLTLGFLLGRGLLPGWYPARAVMGASMIDGQCLRGCTRRGPVRFVPPQKKED